MRIDELAWAFEKSRYELLRPGNDWGALREGERQARVDAARTALRASGLAGRIENIAARAGASDDLAALLMARDAELARRVAEHDAEVTALEQRVAALEGQLRAARAASDGHLARA